MELKHLAYVFLSLFLNTKLCLFPVALVFFIKCLLSFNRHRSCMKCHMREFAVAAAGVGLCQQGCPDKGINSYLITRAFRYSVPSDFSQFPREALCSCGSSRTPQAFVLLSLWCSGLLLSIWLSCPFYTLHENCLLWGHSLCEEKVLRRKLWTRQVGSLTWERWKNPYKGKINNWNELTGSRELVMHSWMQLECQAFSWLRLEVGWWGKLFRKNVTSVFEVLCATTQGFNFACLFFRAVSCFVLWELVFSLLYIFMFHADCFYFWLLHACNRSRTHLSLNNSFVNPFIAFPFSHQAMLYSNAMGSLLHFLLNPIERQHIITKKPAACLSNNFSSLT